MSDETDLLWTRIWELEAMVDRATTIIERDSEIMSAVVLERQQLEEAGHIACGIAWDAAVSQVRAETFAVCAHCGPEVAPFRMGEELLTHIANCPNHPLAYAKKMVRHFLESDSAERIHVLWEQRLRSIL